MPNLKRLRKLADHLMHGKLDHEEFDFTTYNHGGRPYTPLEIKKGVPLKKKQRVKNCGTAGCAIGECPFVFRQWYFDTEGLPTLRGHENYYDPQGVGTMKFFDLSLEAERHLFHPEKQFSPKKISDGATKEEVAENIYEFIQRCENDKEFAKKHSLNAV
jgi:hypothetical protein